MRDSLNPIHQFEIFSMGELSLGPLSIPFTNISFYIFLVVTCSSLFLFLTSYCGQIVPSRVQSISELVYEFVASILHESIEPKKMEFFPFVFSLFIFVLVANTIGLFPYFYTVTSQIVVTSTLAILVFMTVLLYGFCRHGFRFLKIFLPVGVPTVLLPLVVMVEIISFLSRPVSLSVRLFANILAGHITLKVFAGFVSSMVTLGPLYMVASVLPLIMTVAITALEFLVAFLQAYVFTVLTCMYLQDAVHPRH